MSTGNRERVTAFVMVAVIATSVVALSTCKANKKPTEPTTPAETMPSVTAIQRRLNELEPESPIRADGKLGPATQAKWDRVFIRESAKAAFAVVAKTEGSRNGKRQNATQ